MAITVRKLLLSSVSFSSTLSSSSLISLKSAHPNPKLSNPSRVLLGFNFNPFSTSSSSTTTSNGDSTTTGRTKKNDVRSMSDAKLLEKLRMRRLKGAVKARETNETPPEPSTSKNEFASGFWKVGLSEEMIRAVGNTDMVVPTEIQCVGIPAILEGKSVLLSSASESGKTLAYLLPLIQLLRQNEPLLGNQRKPSCSQAVILSSTREKSLEAFYIAKFFSHDVQFRPIRVTDEGQPLNDEDSAKAPVDMVVGTLRGVLNYIGEGNMVFSDICYLVLDQIDSMYESGLGPEISKFLGLLKSHTSSDNPGFQAILVSGPVTKLLGEQFNPVVQRVEQDHAGEVAAAMLELDQAEVYHLIDSLDALKDKVAEAIATVQPAASEHDNKRHTDSLPSSVKK